MITQLKPDLCKYVENISQCEEIDSNLDGQIYGNLSSHLIEIFDMEICLKMRVNLENLIDESPKDRDWITSKRMI